jgi:molybdate transport system ATP-binding protein
LRLATYLVLMEGGKTVAQGTLGEMSLNPALRAIIGADAVGAVINGLVVGNDGASGLTRVRVGAGELNVKLAGYPAGQAIRVQLLARDIIVAMQAPQALSVRNSLMGMITAVKADEDDSDLVDIDIGGTVIMARVTRAATRELGLTVGLKVWALVKAVSLRGHTFPTPI